MSESVLYMSMSLDGYIAGPNDKPDNPGGDGFMRLHEWFATADGEGTGSRSQIRTEATTTVAAWYSVLPPAPSGGIPGR